MDKIFVIGHKNPDTDAVTGSISLSYLKYKLGVHAEPRILGAINQETQFALNRFKHLIVFSFASTLPKLS